MLSQVFFIILKLLIASLQRGFLENGGGGHLGHFSNFRGGQFEGQVGKVEGIKLHNT